MRSLGKLDVSYGQVGVFWAILAKPFNDWSEAHVRQGFAWRPGSVSFKTRRLICVFQPDRRAGAALYLVAAFHWGRGWGRVCWSRAWTTERCGWVATDPRKVCPNQLG